MENLWCAECKKIVPGNKAKFSRHYRRLHIVARPAGTSFSGLLCGQDGCARRFNLFSSMLRHIQKIHSRNAGQPGPGIDNEQGPGDIQQGLHDHHQEPGNHLAEEGPNHQEGPDNQGVNVNPEDEEEVEFDVKGAALKMVCNLRCNSSVTGTVITGVMEQCASIYEGMMNSLKVKVEKVFASKNMVEDEEVQCLLNEFTVKESFLSLKSLKQQLAALEENSNFVKPRDIYLGHRVENAFCKQLGKYRPKTTLETCQYVSIIEIIRIVLSNKAARDQILFSEHVPDEDLISCFQDGLVFRSNAFFRQHPNAIRILLNSDGVEVVNPLGSKTKVHKLGAFYAAIMNLIQNSQLSSIHTLLLCCEEDLKKYGYHVVLDEFMRDVKALENGVEMTFDGVTYTIYGAIAAYSGDTLAAHEIFNLLGPSAKKFCRNCPISREDLQSGNIKAAAIRTRELYEQQLAYVKDNPGDENRRTETGIVGDCVLHSSKHFRLYNNWAFDILHDLFEGIAPYELKLVVHEFVIVRKVCTIDQLNRSIHAFTYGSTDITNKPSSSFASASLRNLQDHTLKQKGAQTWCLLRIFPFLFNHLVPREDPYMQLILQLIRIVEIVVAPKIPRSILPYLSELIDDHLALFRELFPTMPYINKHHHLTHYPECFRQVGPLRDLWCFRFEGANAVLNRHGKVMCNFRNAPKTLIRVGQFQQMQTWGQGTFTFDRVSSSQGSCVEVGTLSCAQNLKDNGFKESEKVYSALEVEIKGTKYKTGMFVCIEAARKRDKNLPLFGKIKEIVILRTLFADPNTSSVFFLVAQQEPVYYDPDFHAYPVLLSSPTDDHKFLQAEECADYKPLSVWTSSLASDRVFLSFRHYVC